MSAVQHAEHRPPEQLVLRAIQNLLEWIKANGFDSYDQYDLWSTRLGKFAKKTYYENRFFGTPLVAPLVLTDTLFPSARRLFVRRNRVPIADAHLIMGFVNMYDLTSDGSYLEKAHSIADDLLNSSIPGYSGYCWGYPFDWQTNRGLWERNTPLITTTPYCFEAFLRLYDATHEDSYLDIAESSLAFALNDLNESEYSRDLAACSYSPIDASKVINANAYRSFMLLEGYKRFVNRQAKEIAIRNINFVLESQRDDGSWLYAVENRQDAFVDNLHTCFVLKNLFKANLIFHDERIEASIEKGYRYYRDRLFYEDGTPKPFAELHGFSPAKVEMYDFAEGISLGVLLKDSIEGAFEKASHLVNKLLQYQTKHGYFVTRVGPLGIKNRVPYLRWPQSQLFFALTQYLKAIQD